MANQNFRVKTGLEVGTAVTISGGIVTATSFVGSGSQLTNISSNYANISGVSSSVVGGAVSATSLRVTGVSTFDGAIQVRNGYNLNIGDNNDLRIYNDGTDSRIEETGSGSLYISGSDINIQQHSTNKNFARFVGPAAELYYDNSKEFETTGYGATVYGTLQSQGLNVSGVGTFLSSGLQIRNPANTFSYSIAGGAIAADYTLTLPVVTSNTGIALTGVSNTFTAAQTFSQTLTASSTLTLSGSTTGTHAFGSNQTTGTLTFGGTSGTGTITLGRATTSQITNIQAGASGVGTTKIINLGTGGLSGSFTQINIGPTAGVGTVVINSATNLLVGTTTATGTASQRLQVIGGGYFSGSVGVGTTNPLDSLTVLGRVQVQQDSGSNNRLILRGQPGSSYRWNIDNNGSSNEFRIFREDDATTANGSVAVSISTTGKLSDSKGDVRAIPQNSQTSAYILTASDVGKHVSITTGGITVNTGTFSVGDVVSIYNNSGSNQTITQGTSVTIYLAGTPTTGNRTLAQRGICTILCVGSETFIISGAGLT